MSNRGGRPMVKADGREKREVPIVAWPPAFSIFPHRGLIGHQTTGRRDAAGVRVGGATPAATGQSWPNRIRPKPECPGGSAPGVLLCLGRDTVGRGSGSRVVLSLPECGWGLLPHFRSAESGGPRIASPRFPATRTLSLISFRPRHESRPNCAKEASAWCQGRVPRDPGRQAAGARARRPVDADAVLAGPAFEDRLDSAS